MLRHPWPLIVASAAAVSAGWAVFAPLGWRAESPLALAHGLALSAGVFAALALLQGLAARMAGRRALLLIGGGAFLTFAFAGGTGLFPGMVSRAPGPWADLIGLAPGALGGFVLWRLAAWPEVSVRTPDRAALLPAILWGAAPTALFVCLILIRWSAAPLPAFEPDLAAPRYVFGQTGALALALIAAMAGARASWRMGPQGAAPLARGAFVGAMAGALVSAGAMAGAAMLDALVGAAGGFKPPTFLFPGLEAPGALAELVLRGFVSGLAPGGIAGAMALREPEAAGTPRATA